ncbi:glycosyltransferase [Nakamurella sp. YIM 132087]|uniref:Glycosyltransferase n=1 Tax=Nakamurella alba TaxID=2665158 RepID=A0A7K1FE54_9ACTN|nr:glycosyltransferase family A protein [Nakamurella alba]MTD12382.1 glycosyltransferase [Nakamurella alba]
MTVLEELADPRPSPGPAAVRVRIAMLTFHRPQDLAEVLPLLTAQADEAARHRWPAGRSLDVGIVIVDNDPAGSGRPAVRASGVSVHYVVEPTPGIAAARNRALDETTGADIVVFIDDDERPHPRWLVGLLETHFATGAAAVAGPVISQFVGDLDPWVAAGAFFHRRRLPTGTRIEVAATNNLLLDRRQVDALRLRFDRRFGLSGADDTYFSSSLHRSGAEMVWCDSAIVTDVVPAERMTRSWVVRRAFSSGNSSALVAVELRERVLGRTATRLRQIGRGLIRCAAGGTRFAAGLVLTAPSHQTRGLRTLARGAGMLVGSASLIYQEYGAASKRKRRLRRLGPVN